MTQGNRKERIQKLYHGYLSGNISREEYEELFDLIGDESNQSLVESVIDGSLPADVILTDKLPGGFRSNSPALKVPPAHRFKRRMILRLSAAAAALLLISAMVYILTRPQTQWIIYTTDYQETKKVELPDGSIVILNANSELKWQTGMEKESRRTVTFSGEGFFDIAHLEGKSFTVNTKGIDVNVLGTEFNLETRRDYTNVYLKEGRVILKGEDIEPVKMEPGDLVHYNKEKKVISKVKNLQPEAALSWKEGVFTFLELTGIQILDKMEDIYGKEFIVRHPEDLSDVIVIQGLPYTDWDFTSEALELALGVRLVDSTANMIVVENR